MRKEEIRHDPVRENIVKGVEYIKDNQNSVLIFFIGLTIAIATISYYNHTGSIKNENASNIAGLAQNTYINGNTDEALVKFERLMNDYPNTFGGTQSLIYLLSDAIFKDNYEEASIIITQHKSSIGSIYDSFVKASIFKIQGDIALHKGNEGDAIDYYNQAESSSKMTSHQVKYKLDSINALILQGNYNDAKNILDDIIKIEDLDYNDRNMTEELLAHVRHILGT